MTKRIISALICLLAVSGTSVAREATNTVSEDIFIYLLAGPSTQYRILGSLKAGEALTATGKTQGEYSEVIDEKGRKGWIQTEQMGRGESFRTKVPALTEALAQTRSQLESVTAERDALLQSNQEASANAEAKVAELKAEVQEQARAMSTLEQKNAELSKRVETLSQSERFIWMQQGGMVAGAGLILGLIVAYLPRPKRKRKNDGWA
ncbi:TIGR04211 family SH3 domain-containing protein [Ferrimonas balearica]|uniref:TIGR04211 family SH3 domain-containing protein n=1 Tax=Ferrimonas balearica TaxID=44012 RepID=UPI001C94B864|nr:TIGR04211 family SH3 domain-containing protein [Ferrimonas balearica]MBY5981336.1 TIGR04211 family SH3 domain-containing protein [Ferrimonas balearica]